MEEKNPLDILNDFKSGKTNISTAIEGLLSISRDSGDENLKIQVSDILLEMYRSAESEKTRDSEQVKTFMEKNTGKKFISIFINPSP